MLIPFTKYHGTGNDFIIIDDRSEKFDIENVELIESMCSRRFGIGADGLILLREAEGFDFQMVYFNADGNQSSMCGNGGRCIVHFAKSLGVFDEKCSFVAIDGPHEAYINEIGLIKLKMGEVDWISRTDSHHVLNTGSPHYVKVVQNIDVIDIKKEGARIRYSDNYKSNGINVNFLELHNDKICVATYERGVEDETYSCGTGVTAAALVANLVKGSIFQSPIKIETKGGSLKVYFEKSEESVYSDVWLEGMAVQTYEGTWSIS